MIRFGKLAATLMPLLVVFGAGCAPAYHKYSGCYVNCRYCVPPPLPYTHYKGCVCHSCAASNYLSAATDAVDEDKEGLEDVEKSGNDSAD